MTKTCLFSNLWVVVINCVYRYLNQNFMLEENANTWTKNASVLYIDSLFGLGFSETPNAQNEDYIHSDQVWTAL